jgi:hypothetical protein
MVAGALRPEVSSSADEVDSTTGSAVGRGRGGRTGTHGERGGHDCGGEAGGGQAARSDEPVGHPVERMVVVRAVALDHPDPGGVLESIVVGLGCEVLGVVVRAEHRILLWAGAL